MARILLIETHSDVTEVIRCLLQDEGHIVLVATTLQAAEQELATKTIDVLLTDLFAQDGPTWPWLEQRVAELHRRGTRVVIQSGVADRDQWRAIERAGLDWLVRPYGIDELIDAIERQPVS